ncbi:hypothetical protein SEPCBS119000_000104, partial [Sporothrix epigloea]
LFRSPHAAFVSDEVGETVADRHSAGQSVDIVTTEKQAAPEHGLHHRPGPLHQKLWYQTQLIHVTPKRELRKEVLIEGLAAAAAQHRAASLAAAAAHRKRKREYDDDELLWSRAKVRATMAKCQAHCRHNPFARQDAETSPRQQNLSRLATGAGLLPTPYWWSRLDASGARRRKCSRCCPGGAVVPTRPVCLSCRRESTTNQGEEENMAHLASQGERQTATGHPQTHPCRVTKSCLRRPLHATRQIPTASHNAAESALLGGIVRTASVLWPLLDSAASLQLPRLVRGWAIDQVWQPLAALVADTARLAPEKREAQLYWRRACPRSRPPSTVASLDVRRPTRSVTRAAAGASTLCRQQPPLRGKQSQMLRLAQFRKYTPNDPRLFFGYLS